MAPKNDSLIANLTTTNDVIDDVSGNAFNEASTWSIETKIQIPIACSLVVFAVVVLLIIVCKSSRWNCCAKWWQYGDALDEEYDKIKDLEKGMEKRRKKAVLGQINIGMKITDGTKEEDAASKKQTPITRIHPVGANQNSGSPTLAASHSPAITRAYKNGNIPFELPPSASGRFTETLQIQPELSHSPSWGRTSWGSHGNLNQSDSGSSEESGGSGTGTPTIPRSLTSHSPLFPRHMVPTHHNTFIPRSPEQYRNSLLGRIQPELYKCSECKDNDLHQSRCGRVWFSMVYDGAVESLTVKVIKVKQLQPRMNTEHPRDSFVKLFLLPDERISQQTKVRLRTNNPLFNETFVFQVSECDLRNRSLRLSVYDVEKRKSTRHLLGHALVSLNDIDPSKANEDIWRDLDDIAHPGDSGSSLGELNMALTYAPNLERLTVVILEARNLRRMDLEATGIYVKVALSQGHHVIKTKKTATQDGVSDPRYNESFSFKVTSKDMEQTCLSISVITNGGRGTINKMTSQLKNTVTRGRYGAEHKYGRVSIGSFMFCRGEQLLHWQEMMAQPRKSISKWHPLSEVVTSQ